MRFFILILFFTTSALAQNDQIIETGSIENAGYKIIIPADWNKNLVMFAHGYEFMGSKPRQSQNPGFDQQMKPYLDRGFAVAASDYCIQGFALPQGVDDTEALRKYFIQKYGEPDKTFMVGGSMGGGVTLAMMENFPDSYVGGLALCPFASRPYLQIRKEFDIYAVFNALFPGVIPTLSEIMDIDSDFKPTGFAEMGQKMQKIQEAIAQDTVAAKLFAIQFGLKVSDIPMSLFFNEGVLRDIALKAGGNPIDNTNTVYSGFGNDYELNQKVERLPATVEEDDIFGKYDRTGAIGKPVVLVHTVYDQLIPPQYGVINFDNMVHQQNKEDLLVVKYTNGQGHCQFTPEQIGKAFDELQQWALEGEKPKPGAMD